MYSSKTDELTIKAKQAIECINTTQAPIFLTGNAGTGKTTFLKNLSVYTHKKFIIVAPTGIAALNAGGTTIHSQFLLPHGTFLPGRDSTLDTFSPGNQYNQHILARKHPLNSHRKKILRSIDLLVIDEVSMLRADLLDAIDYRLRSARGNVHQPFGGVQILFIGDLYQLPPVVRREDESLLHAYYQSPWFFEAICLQKTELVYVELDKIFRQQDEKFINILNNLRHNRATPEDYEVLNTYYNQNLNIHEIQDTITLTTHNQQAENINQLALEQLPGKLFKFQATISGDFSDGMFPVPQLLLLKEGSQIMFVKNDTENKSYFNGRLATITNISDEGVEVKMHDDGSYLIVNQQKWENKKYTIDPNSQDIIEMVTGTFEQLPIKLAWAITIHKSQGLTFEKAIIDPGRAFADGQVYVALSRLKSLNGLTLKTRVHPGVISTDRIVVHFTEHRIKENLIERQLEKKQREYAGERMVSAFDLEGIIRALQPGKKIDQQNPDESEQLRRVFQILLNDITEQEPTTDRFREQLLGLLHHGDLNQLFDRLKKGSLYYINFFWKWITDINRIALMSGNNKLSKSILSITDEAEHLLVLKLTEIERIGEVVYGILKGGSFPVKQFEEQDENRRKKRSELLQILKVEIPVAEKKPKKIKNTGSKTSDKQASHLTTIMMFKSGKSGEEIASLRNLVPGTIEQHLLQGVKEGILDINEWISSELQQLFREIIAGISKPVKIKEVYQAAGGRISFGMLRALIHSTREEDIRIGNTGM